MKDLSIGLVFSALLLCGAAFAQDSAARFVASEPDTPYYAGASFGGLRGSIALGGHFALRDFITDDVDLRLDATALLGGFNDISVGALALYNLEFSDSLPLTLYAGGGPEIFLGNSTALGLGLRTGAGYTFSSTNTNLGNVGVFTELRLDPILISGNRSTLDFFFFGYAVGFRFYF